MSNIEKPRERGGTRKTNNKVSEEGHPDHHGPLEINHPALPKAHRRSGYTRKGAKILPRVNG